MRLTTFSLPHIMCFYIIVSHISKHLDFLLTTTSWCLIPFFHSPSVSNLSFLLSLLHLYTLTFQINIVVFSFPFSLSPGKIFKDLFCFVFLNNWTAQKLLKSSYFLFQAIGGALLLPFFARTFCLASAAVGLRCRPLAHSGSKSFITGTSCTPGALLHLRCSGSNTCERKNREGSVYSLIDHKTHPLFVSDTPAEVTHNSWKFQIQTLTRGCHSVQDGGSEKWACPVVGMSCKYS